MTKNKGDQKLSEGTVSYIPIVKWLSSFSYVGDHEIKIYQKIGLSHPILRKV